MKEEKPQNVSDDDNVVQDTPSLAWHLETSGRSSMMPSLRTRFASDIAIIGGDEDTDDDDSFVFTDQMHQRQEFELFTDNFRGYFSERDGPCESGDNKSKPENGESTPLLNETNTDIKEKTIKTNTEASKQELVPKTNAFNRGQKELFLEVLDEIDKIQNTTRKEKGFKEWKFTFGLMNCLLITYVFGSYPEHFWILYAVQTVFFMSYKFIGMYRAKPLSEVLYYLDFCWVMNASGVLIIISITILNGFLPPEYLSMEARKIIFLANFGVMCGPVFMASMALPFVAFLFHDLNTMCNLIIHLLPSMAMYHHRWHAVEITNAYPTVFPHLAGLMEEINSGKSTESVMQLGLTLYFLWFIPYTSWMLLGGLKLPTVSKDKEKPLPKYDTVFHSLWKGGVCELIGTKVWKRPIEISRDCSERDDYEVRDFLLYMAAHAISSCGIGIILLSDILCFRGGKTVHATLIWVATILCAKRGADRYTYYVTSMYGQKLRKVFRELENRKQNKQ